MSCLINFWDLKKKKKKKKVFKNLWPGTKLSLYFEKVSNENDVVGVLIRIIEVIEDVEKSSVFSIWASERASDKTQNSEVSHGRRVKIRDRTERVHKASPPRSQAQILRRQRRPPRPRFTSKRRRRDHRLSPYLPHSPRPSPSARDLSHPPPAPLGSSLLSPLAAPRLCPVRFTTADEPNSSPEPRRSSDLLAE